MDNVSGRTTYQIFVDSATAESEHTFNRPGKRNKVVKWLFSLKPTGIPGLFFLAVMLLVVLVLPAVYAGGTYGGVEAATTRLIPLMGTSAAVMLKSVWAAIERGTFY